MVNGHVFYFYKNMPYENAINKKFEQASTDKYKGDNIYDFLQIKFYEYES